GVGRGTRPLRDAASSRPSRRPSRRRRAPVRGRAGPPRPPTGGGTRSPEPRRPLPGPQWRRARGSRTTSTASGRRSRTSLDEEPPDHGLGLRIVALADVPVPDDPLPVHEEQGGPRSHAEPGPDREVVVLHDRVAHAEPLRRVDDLRVRLLPEELRAVDTDDGEPQRRVPFVPRPQLRDHVAAVDSAVRPELDEDDAGAQAWHRQGVAVDPRLPGDVRSRVAEPQRLAGGRRGAESDERREEREHGASMATHGYCFFTIIITSSYFIILSSFIVAFSPFSRSPFFMPSVFISPLCFLRVPSCFISSCFVSCFFTPSVFIGSLWANVSPTTPVIPKDSPGRYDHPRAREPAREPSHARLLEWVEPSLRPVSLSTGWRSRSSKRCEIFVPAARRERSDDLVGPGGGLAEPSHRVRREPPVDLLEAQVDLSVRHGEEALSLAIPLHGEGTEALDPEHPEGLGDSELREPVNVDDALDAPTVRGAHPVPPGRE